MSNTPLQFLLSLSILIPVIAAMIRLKNIPKVYFPLIYLLCIGLINEVINYFFFRENNAVPVNIYYMVEFLFYCWQFRNWKNILKSNTLFYFLTGSVSFFWIIDELVLMKISTFSSLILVLYPFILLLMAVNELNYLVANEHGNILKNPIFIFCIAVIIFHSYRLLSEIFYHYANQTAIKERIFSIQTNMNVLFNILLTLVVLCIPKKRTILQR